MDFNKATASATAQIADRARYRAALRIARERFASEAATWSPVPPQWRERVIELIDEALHAAAPSNPHPDSCGCRACDVARNQGIFPMRGL